jgi:hypothetical protein
MPVIKIRRGTTTQWTASTRVLQVGELGLDTTLNRLKVGNGTATWTNLPFLTVDTAGLSETAQDAVATALAAGTHSNITVTYNDNDNSISLATGPDVITQTSLSNTLTNATTGYVSVGDVGQADGVASLDSSGKIPDSEIPDTIARDSEIPSLTGYATESYVTTAISNLVDTAPTTLNTLNELAAAINDDASFASTVTTALGGKEPSLPSQTNNSGKFLTTDGTNKSWAIIPAATPTSAGTLFGLVDVDDENVALGPNSLNTTTTGVYNIAVGSFALTDITSGDANIGIGYTALNYLTTGSDNTAVGQQALEVLTTGSDNVAIGNNTMNAGGAATYNTAIGSYSLYSNESTGNTAAGYYAGHNNIGAGNVFIGQNAGLSSTSGDNNIVIGNGAEVSAATTDNEITLGNSSITKFKIPGLGVNWDSTGIIIQNNNNTVPLTIQNNGSANSFVVNDVESDTTPFVIDNNGNVGIGLASPLYKLHVYNTLDSTVGSISSSFQTQVFNGNQDYIKIYNERTTTTQSWNGSDWILRRHVDNTAMGGFRWAAGDSNVRAIYGSATSPSIRTSHISTSAPSGGIDGDIWLVYTA